MAAFIYTEVQKKILRRERVFRDRTNILDTLTDQELISRYRFPRDTILKISEEVAELVERPTCRTNSIPTHIQVMATLRFLGKADFFSEIADIHGISKASVSRIIHKVCSAINSKLNNIIFQTEPPALKKAKEDFFEIAGFPNVIGAIDGTLIPIIGMSGDEEHAYVCRKGFHALNIQAIVDAKMKFININARYPGATHDAYVLSNSGIPMLMEELRDHGWILGDSGYPLKDWLLTPFANPVETKQEEYNKAHSKTRVIVERAFGVLKSRFRCLHQSGGCLQFIPIKCSRIIEACFRLHNRAIDDKIPLISNSDIQHLHNESVFHGQPTASAQQRRLQVAERF